MVELLYSCRCISEDVLVLSFFFKDNGKKHKKTIFSFLHKKEEKQRKFVKEFIFSEGIFISCSCKMSCFIPIILFYLNYSKNCIYLTKKFQSFIPLFSYGLIVALNLEKLSMMWLVLPHTLPTGKLSVFYLFLFGFCTNFCLAFIMLKPKGKKVKVS